MWEVQGSNDGKDFTTIFAHDGKSFWDQRLQVVLFEAGEDYEVQKTGYRFFRHVTFDTAFEPRLGRIFKSAKLSSSAMMA